MPVVEREGWTFVQAWAAVFLLWALLSGGRWLIVGGDWFAAGVEVLAGVPVTAVLVGVGRVLRPTAASR